MSEVIIPHNYILGDTTSNIEVDTDFIGFTFNGKHSSELGIVRTSDGSRFNESLLPVISDKTVQVPGADGTYYFGSNYTHRVFDIPFAFDSLTEKQFQDLKRWLGDKKIHDLIFDEAPYKIYRAKITGSATIKHIPFSEGDTNRVYKGEGNIQFTAYDPFARSAFKYLSELENLFVKAEVKESDYKSGTYYIIENNKYKKEDDSSIYSSSKTYYKINPRIAEWIDASGMLIDQGKFDKLDDNEVPLYNPGVKEADFVLALKFLTDAIPDGSISIDGFDSILKMDFKQIVKQNTNDVEIRFNSKLNLIEGYDENGLKTGAIYNRFITSGDFFKIPISTKIEDSLVLVLDSVSSNFSFIEYNYYYF